MSDSVPLTPPRRSSRKQSTVTTPNQYALLTPATSTKKQQKSFGTAISNGKLSVITPNTPQKSPSKSSYRKRNFNDIFNEPSTHQNEKLPMGLFLPSPRIVGSGRNGKHLPAHKREAEVPTTPGKQVVTEQMVRQWQESDEEEVEVMTLEEAEQIPRVSLPNPFLATEESKAGPFSENKIDYNTHMELIDKTGKRKVVKLTKNQMKIKPKKLSFEGL